MAPLLAVEVLSPSSRLTDPGTKKLFYERLGVRSYWLVDPDLDAPSLKVLMLNDEGVYKETAHVVGDEPYEADEPFAVTVVPSALVAGARPAKG